MIPAKETAMASTEERCANALSSERIEAAIMRVNDLWPEGLDAVPGSYEVEIKRDADTLRALATFYRNFRAFADATYRGSP
jgi:hypothetical protein